MGSFDKRILATLKDNQSKVSAQFYVKLASAIILCSSIRFQQVFPPNKALSH
jgi:hypothetical protein